MHRLALILAVALTTCGGDAETTASTTDLGTGAPTGTTTEATPTSSTSSTPTDTAGSASEALTSTTTGDPTTDSATEPTTTSNTTDAPLPPGVRQLRFINACPQTVWVGTIGNPIAPETTCAGDQDCGADQVCDHGNKLCTWLAPDDGGWELLTGATYTVQLPPAWGGRFWPRTGCADFNDDGVPACQTGDCGGHLGCPAGVGGSPPATLAEFTLIPPDQPVGLDFYDVSAVDGTNLPVRITAVLDTFNNNPPPGTNTEYYCGSPGCTEDCGPLAACAWNLDTTCPPELRQIVDGKQVGCRSAGQVCAIDPQNPVLACATTNDLYGCTEGGPNGVIGSCYSDNAAPTCCGCPSWSPQGECNNNNPEWQLPSAPEKYAKVFKDACPTAYSFPYDDPTSTFTCQGRPDKNVDYDITFCP